MELFHHSVINACNHLLVLHQTSWNQTSWKNLGNLENGKKLGKNIEFEKKPKLWIFEPTCAICTEDSYASLFVCHLLSVQTGPKIVQNKSHLRKVGGDYTLKDIC